MNEDLKKQITISTIKKILGNKENMQNYLTELFKIKGIKTAIPDSPISLIELIIETWDYSISKNVIRNLFKNTSKYLSGKCADRSLSELINEWNKLNLGPLEWPFSAMGYDAYIQGINHSNVSSEEKDQQVMTSAVKFRRIKEINTYRNDYIETLIFEKKDTIIPTLKHSRSVDFYIDGIAYDQKVSKSVTREFESDFGTNYKEYAKKHPEKVAEYLYKYQDEDRFGDEPRLLVVYLDSDIQTEKIADIVTTTNFDNPINLKFTYNHAKSGPKDYETKCFVILLYN